VWQWMANSRIRCQVGLAEDDEAVQALAADTLHEALRVRVAIWTPRQSRSAVPVSLNRPKPFPCGTLGSPALACPAPLHDLVTSGSDPAPWPEVRTMLARSFSEARAGHSSQSDNRRGLEDVSAAQASPGEREPKVLEKRMVQPVNRPVATPTSRAAERLRPPRRDRSLSMCR
jgi:hypothetical protein